MEQLFKMTNINKYITAIKAVNALRTAVYVSIAALSLMNIYKVYKAIVK